MFCAVQGHGITRVVKHVFSLQKFKSWYYHHLYCLGAHAWLGSRDNVPGGFCAKNSWTKVDNTSGDNPNYRFSLGKMCFTTRVIPWPCTAQNMAKRDKLYTKRCGILYSTCTRSEFFWDKFYVKIFCLLTTSLGFRQIGCHGNPQCTYENILPSDLLAYP